MYYILLLLLILSQCYRSVDIVVHYDDNDHSRNGFTLDSTVSIQNSVESTHIIQITNITPEKLKSIGFTNGSINVIKRYVNTSLLEYIVDKDHCILLKSGLSLNFTTNTIHGITLKVFCNTSIDDDDDDDDDETKPLSSQRSNNILTQTLTYIKSRFDEENVLYSKNIGVSSPHSITYPWMSYGSTKHIKQLLRNKFHHEERDKMNQQYKKLFSKKNNSNSSKESIIENSVWPIYTQSGISWYGLDRIDSGVGSLDGKYKYFNTASDIDIYIIDTGIRVTHEEFGGRAHFLINTAADGKNYDCNGHGTHVSGIAGSNKYGVAKNATLFAVKVLDCDGNGDLFSIQLGIAQVIETSQSREGAPGGAKKRRSVVNLSLGGTKSSILDQAILSLSQHNIFVSVSAGNLNADACQYSPANLGGDLRNNVLTVAASDISDKKAKFSNYGECVGVSAPGQSIESTWITDDHSSNTISGTSMSSPFGAGVGALVLQSNLELSVSEVIQLIRLWSTPGIIINASPVGGGRDLLYSLIKYDEAPPFIHEPSSQPPSPPSFKQPMLINSAFSCCATEWLMLTWFLFTMLMI
jgi:subtilisin family serine protease